MNFFQKAVTRAIRPLIKSQRRWNGARVSSLTQDWCTALSTEDKELKRDLRKLVERCRDLEKNDNTVARALLLLEDNVVGAEGFKLQNKAYSDRPNKDGRYSLDRNANEKVEKVWSDFCKDPTVCELWNMSELCRVTQRMKARDGNAFWRIYRGPEYKFGLKIRLVDITYLATELHKVLDNGNRISFGVESNPLGAPLAYHFYKTNPHGLASGSKVDIERVPASDVIHFTKRISPEQSVGAPLFSPSIIKLKMLGEYEEAHVVMARLSASKMGVIETTIPEGNTDYVEAQPTMDFSPGTIAELPPGKTFRPVDFGLGTEKFGTIVDHALRGIAGMIGVSYVSLANDLSGVNYSSIRAGILEEREHYKAEQQYMIDNGLLPIFLEVEEMAALNGKLALPASKLDRLLAPKFIPRRWSWVNPQQDIQAQILAINNGLQTRTRVCAENGVDFEELVDELAQEQQLLAERGVNLITVSGAIVTVEQDRERGRDPMS